MALHDHDSLSTESMEEAHYHNNNGVTQNNSEQLKKPKKKPKLETSVSHDKERGVYTCKRCGWVYPNPRPSAKHRRDHRKHCGKFESVNAWLVAEPHSETEKKQGEDLYMDTSDDQQSSSSLSMEENGTNEVRSMKEGDKQAEETEQDVSEVPTELVKENETGINTEIQAQDTDIVEQEADQDVSVGDDTAGLSTEASQEMDRQKEVSDYEDNATLETSYNYNEIHENGVQETHRQDIDNDATLSQFGETNPTTLSPNEVQSEIQPEQDVQDVAVHHEASEQSNKTFVSWEGTGTGTSKENHDVVSHEETGTVNYDLEKILKEQTSHHLLCPNCGSCITRRVILKKRKRTVVDIGKEQEKLAKVVEETSLGNAAQQPDNEPKEAWGCLACFSIFFRKVRDELEQPPPADRAGHVSCLPYLLPNFHWDGEGLEVSQGDRQGSSCLPFEFPWRWTRVAHEEEPTPVSEEGDITDVEIVIDLSKPPKTLTLSDYIRWKLHQESERSRSCLPLSFGQTDSGNCLPVVLPTYWGKQESVSEQEQNSVGEDDKKAGLNCLPALLPTYTWKSYSSTVIQSNITQNENVKPDAPVTQVDKKTSVSAQVQTSDRNITIKQEIQEIQEVQIQEGKTADKDATEEIQEQQTPEKETASKDDAKEIRRVTKVVTTEETDERKSGFNCLPLSLPTYTWKKDSQESVKSTGQSIESTESIQGEIQNEDVKNKASLNCIPALLPAYSWGQMQATESVKDGEKAGLNCLPALALPAYSWGSSAQPTQPTQNVAQEQQAGQTETSTVAEVPISDGKEGATWNCLPGLLEKSYQETPTLSQETNDKEQSKAEKDNICLPVGFPNYLWRSEGTEAQEEETYITKETRIQAWIKTITNRVTVKSKGPDADSVKETETEQIGSETTHVDMTVNQQKEGEESQVSSHTLVTTPSTGWALVDALDKGSNLNEDKLTAIIDEGEEEEGGLIDKRKTPNQQTEIRGLEDNEVTSQVNQVKEDNSVKQLDQTAQIQTEDDLTQPLLTPQQKDRDMEAILTSLASKEEPKTTRGPVTTTVSVKGPDGIFQVTGQDTRQTVDAALAIADVDGLTAPGVHTPEYEYVKSIVYGGLDVTLTSLALISSGAGSGTKTLNVLAISLANLITGLIMLFHNIGNLYRSDRASFEEQVGQRLWVNGSISIVSFLVFGCVGPLTYGLSFRTSDDRDYKFAATAAVSLVCLVLLGLAKAYVKKQKYVKCVIDLILTGFVAAVAGYFVGDYVSRWLEKLGFETQAPAPAPSPPEAPPPPFFPDIQKFDLGRRGRTFI